MSGKVPKEVNEVAQAVIGAARLGDLEVGVSFVDDQEMRALNLAWRGMDRSTDVLSFSALEGEAVFGAEDFLGDLVISLERASAQAREHGHSLREEVAVLVSHGLLHLLGLDHERDDDEAVWQAECEMTLLAAAGIDPGLALVGRSLGR